MSWSQLGWVVIALSVILMASLWIVFHKWKGYPVRCQPAAETLIDARVASIEQGHPRQIILGHQLWSQAFPGLGLHALAVLPSFLDPETGMDGGLTVSGADGSLVVFARQIIQGRYQDGFSADLSAPGVRVALPGPTPLAFTAGLLPQLGADPNTSLVLFGFYGPEALLWTEATAARGGHTFAAAGTLASQAALYLSVRDLLIGEEVFLLPGLLEETARNHAGWLTEDILRFLLILLLITAAILKMVGVL
jgi:hypothetical protein